MRGGRPLTLALSAAVTAAALWALASLTSPREVISLLRGIGGGGLLLFVLLSLTMSLLRTWRYDLLLRTGGHRAPRGALFLTVLVRNFLSDLLPARIGTLSYVYLANSRLGVPLNGALSSFALAFCFDILALAPLVLLAVASFGAAGGQPRPLLLLAQAVLLLLVTLGVIAALPALVRFAARICAGLLRPEGGRRRRCLSLLNRLEEELRCAREAGTALKLFCLSLLVRITKYASLYFLLLSLVRPLGHDAAGLPPLHAFLGLVGAEAAASLPVSGIAGFGAYEGAWAAIFSLLGMSPAEAAATGVAHHVFTQAYGYGLGLLALALLLLLPARRREGIPSREREE